MKRIDSSKEILSKYWSHIVAIVLTAVISFSVHSYTSILKNEFLLSLVFVGLVCIVLLGESVPHLIKMHEIKKENERYEFMRDSLRFAIIHKLREERWIVDDNGDAIFSATLHIQSTLSVPLIKIPITFIFDKDRENPLADLTISSDGEVLDKDIQKVKNSKYDDSTIFPGTDLNYYIAWIKKDIEKGDTIILDITANFKGVFKNIKTKERLIVNIDYLTENIIVKIRHKDKNIELEPLPIDRNPSKIISAYSVDLNWCDDRETTRQSPNIKHTKNKIEWSSNIPILDYSYVISFKTNSNNRN